MLFIPLSADPMRVLPQDLLSLWPVSAGERRWLRILSPWLNPIAWFVLALVMWKRASIGICAVAAGAFAIGFVLPSVPPARNVVWRRLPDFPTRLNHLIRKNLREMLSTLDFWSSVLASALSLGFRVGGLLPAEALLPLTLLVLLPLSTYAQTLFGLDGDAGLTRLRLQALPGWQILAAKDAPFLLFCVLMTLPLAHVAALGASLAALMVGHYASVTHHSHQAPWRFSSGVSFGASIFQVVVMCATAAAVHAPPLLVLPAFGAYAWSTSWYGRLLEQRSRE